MYIRPWNGLNDPSVLSMATDRAAPRPCPAPTAGTSRVAAPSPVIDSGRTPSKEPMTAVVSAPKLVVLSPDVKFIPQLSRFWNGLGFSLLLKTSVMRRYQVPLMKSVSVGPCRFRWKPLKRVRPPKSRPPVSGRKWLGNGAAPQPAPEGPGRLRGGDHPPRLQRG